MRIAPGTLILPGPVEIARVPAATINRHGGLHVTPDLRKIENTLTEVLAFHAFRPEADIALLAADVAYAFAKGHPLPDGTKRVAFFSMKRPSNACGSSQKPPLPSVIRCLKDSRSGYGKAARRCPADRATFRW